MSDLRLSVLRAPEIEYDGKPLAGLTLLKAQALLVYLSVTARSHTRQALAGLLWTDVMESSARTSLRTALAQLRKTLGDYVLADRHTVSFDRERPHWIDAHVFEDAYRRLQAGELGDGTERLLLRKAVYLYGEGFLAGIPETDAALFEEWVLNQREQYRRLALDALQRLAADALQRNILSEGIEDTRRVLEIDPFREEAHRTLMQLHAKSGNMVEALRQYDECVRILDGELGVPPSEETAALAEALKEGRLVNGVDSASRHPAVLGQTDEPSDPEMPDSPQPVRSVPNNLPAVPTILVGRHSELATLDELMASDDVRLVSIAGPGGMGKTRLALAVAEAELDADRFSDGVFLVALATITTGEDMVTTIADTIGLSAAGSNPEAMVLGQLRARNVLLVLDNFEQLLPAAGFLEQLLATARQVKLLVTTRERLNLQEEWVLDLHGLAYPAESDTGDLRRFDAVSLFIQRASQVRSSFAPASEGVAEIAAICRLVQGMPLGIELAVGWVRVMSLAEIAMEIRQNLDFLATTMRNIPERHRNLRAVFRHSWKMLTAEEQQVFAKLSVFRAGFSRDAAAEVAAISLPGLVSLVDKSLVRHTPAGRYEIHELLRQFGAEMLAEDPKQEVQTQQAHARFFCDFLAQHETALHGGDQLKALAEIRPEQENVRAAWYCALDQRHFHLIDPAIVSWFEFCEMGGYPKQGAQAFNHAVQLTEEMPNEHTSLTPDRYQFMRARLLSRQGRDRTRSYSAPIALFEHALDLLLKLAQQATFDVRSELAYVRNTLGLALYSVGDRDRSEREIREALRVAEEIGETVEIARAWNYLGHVAEFQGRFAESAAFFSRSIEFYSNAGELNRRAYALNNKGRACYGMGDYEEATDLVNQAFAIRTDFNDLTGLAYSYLDLGRIAECQGDYNEAERLMHEALATANAIAVRDNVSRCLIGLGDVALLRGNAQAALVHLQDAHDIAHSLGIQRSIPVCLAGLGRAAHQLRDFDEATSRLEESLQLSHRLGSVGDEARALHALANLTFDQGQTINCARYLQRCLKIAMETGARPMALDALLLGAQLAAENEEQVLPESGQIPALVAHHRASWYHTRQRAFRMMGEDGDGRQAGGQEVGPIVDALIKALAGLATLGNNV